MRTFRFLMLVCIVSVSSVRAQEQAYFPDPDTAIQNRLKQWQDLKFGLLMHWGVYSQWGIVESWSICPEDVEWAAWGRKQGVADTYEEYRTKYEQLCNTFNPTQFNPEKWATAAKHAGMQYVVFTTKHHDGFCIYNTQYTNYKITDPSCPFSTNSKADVTKEIFNAFRQQNMWVGAYFSKPDWHSDYYWWRHFPPADRNANYSIDKFPERWNMFVEFTHNQINELVSNYGKIDILWLDGGWVRKTTDEEVKKYLLDVYNKSRYSRNPQNQDIDMDRLVKNVRKKQPHMLVVDRAVPGIHQNYLTPEQHIPDEGLPYPWETCMTMGNSWSYVPDDTYKSTNELLEKLVDIVSKGGNLLLNIGPSPSGELHDTAYARLQDIGTWMKVNSAAIYGTRMCRPFGEGNDIRYTQSKDGKTKFVFLFDFPKQVLKLKNITLAAKSSITVLGSSGKLKWKKVADGVEITVPKALEKTTNWVWVLRITTP